MNASMLAELKKKQSGESVDDPEPAPRLSSAAVAAAPGFTPCRPSSAQFTSPSEAAPLDDVATALLERPKRPTRTPSRKRVGAAAAPAAAGLLLGRRGSAVADPRIALAALSPALDADAPAADDDDDDDDDDPDDDEGAAAAAAAATAAAAESGDAADAGGWEPAASGAPLHEGWLEMQCEEAGVAIRRNSVRKCTQFGAIL